MQPFFFVNIAHYIILIPNNISCFPSWRNCTLTVSQPNFSIFSKTFIVRDITFMPSPTPFTFPNTCLKSYSFLSIFYLPKCLQTVYLIGNPFICDSISKDGFKIRCSKYILVDINLIIHC